MPIHRDVNRDFFKKWTHEMSYVLGFFAADGYMTLNNRGANFWSIQITDREILYKIRKSLHSNHKISVKVSKLGHKNLYRLQIGSKEMCDDLRKLGYCENKTRSMAIKFIDPAFIADFVRGYFDGDGCVWSGILNRSARTRRTGIILSFTSSSLCFLSHLKDIFLKNDIVGGSIVNYHDKYYRLSYSTNCALKIYNFMYNVEYCRKDQLFLKRKKRIFDNFISKCDRSSAG